MRASLLLILTVLIVFTAPMTTYAQSDWWEDGCDERVVDIIAETTNVIDYQSACDHYRVCDPYDEGDAICQLSTFRVMLEQCPLDDVDNRCHDGAILLAAAIIAYDMPFGESIDWIPPQSVIDNVPQALTAYWNGDDAGALAFYQQIRPEDYTFDIMMPLSRAILYQRLDQPEQALAEYDYAFGVVFQDVMISYARSQLYAELGRFDEASIDVASLAIELDDNPEFNGFITSLQAQHPLDDTIMQDWLLYSLRRSSDGVAGSYAEDLTLLPPRPIRMGVYTELDLIVIIGAKNWNPEDGLGEPDNMLQVLRTDDGETYIDEYPSYYDDYSGSLRLVRNDDTGTFNGTESISYFEGSSGWQFAITPIDAPDPRTGLNGTSLL